VPFFDSLCIYLTVFVFSYRYGDQSAYHMYVNQMRPLEQKILQKQRVKRLLSCRILLISADPCV